MKAFTISMRDFGPTGGTRIVAHHRVASVCQVCPLLTTSNTTASDWGRDWLDLVRQSNDALNIGQ
jgi:hypothetical protein